LLFVLAVILSASFEREGPRYRSHSLNPPPLSPTKAPPLPLPERAGALQTAENSRFCLPDGAGGFIPLNKTNQINGL
jgi:hypothetical protein